MWEEIQRVLTSQNPWSGLIFLIVGAVFGAFVSIYFTMRVTRPRLIVEGGGSGGNAATHTWNIQVINRPTFLGAPLTGETARNVNAWLRPTNRPSTAYLLQWAETPPTHEATIEPGQSRSLLAFSWSATHRGAYSVLDRDGEAVARFDAAVTKFSLQLNDHLGRQTFIRFTVEFDDSHLKNSPQTRMRFPMSPRTRYHMFKGAFRQFRQAMSRTT